MEVGDKTKELNMTGDEIDRLTKALKDDQFRGLLLDYARELSDPENKKKYEEEIKLLEEERGNSIEFINPEPYKVLKMRLNGKQKCFINICTNETVGKPEFSCGISDDGRRGQQWSLPHCMHPGRAERDPKGNKFMIYDVIFHPDTIRMASSHKGFMDMVDKTAIQGIQDGFKVILDKNNVKGYKGYKGTPQPSVIRKPILGYIAKEPPEHPDPLAFPYPDENRLGTATAKTTKGPKTREDSKPKTFRTELQKPREPTIPNYTLKYRSFIDLQNFRCSRDSVQSPRPKEIVVTIEMPLLKSAKDANLEVLGKSLCVESKKPAYRLELPLAYPVDGDKGEAKFTKQSGQLTIILPVLPSTETFDLTVGAGETASDHGTEEEEDNGVEQKQNEQLEEDQRWDGKAVAIGPPAEDNNSVPANRNEVLSYTEIQPTSMVKDNEGLDEPGDCIEEGIGSPENEDQLNGNLSTEMQTPLPFPERISDGNSFTGDTAPAMLPSPGNRIHLIKDGTFPVLTEEGRHAPAARTVEKLTKGDSHMKRINSLGEVVKSPVDINEALPSVQSLPTPRFTGTPPAAMLREIDENGAENVISNHSTSAGLSFQNSLLYELD